jgi:hypothetical protein
MKKIFSLFLAMTAMVAVHATDYYFAGQASGWSSNNESFKFVEVDGVLTLEVADLYGEFKVAEDGNWHPQHGAAAAGEGVAMSTPYTLVKCIDTPEKEFDAPANAAILMPENSGFEQPRYKDAKLTLDVSNPDAIVINLVAGTLYDYAAGPTTYQIVGGSIGWDLTTAVQFEEVDGILTAEVEDMNGTFKIVKNRAWDEQWATNWETGGGLEMGVPYVMGAKTDDKEPGNLAFANPFAGYKNAKFTLEVKEDGSMVLTLVSGDFYAVELDWHLPSSQLGWDCKEAQRFTPVEGEANTYEMLLAEFKGDFKVVFGEWGAEFGAPADNAYWKVNEEYTCAFNTGKNIHSIDDNQVFIDCTIRLVVDYENVVVKITIESETVPSAVEDVVAPNTVTKVIENGQMYILRDGVRYNALGGVVK